MRSEISSLVSLFLTRRLCSGGSGMLPNRTGRMPGLPGFISCGAFFLMLISLITGCGIGSSNMVREYNDFGVKCAKMGLWDEAIMRWKRVIEVDPNNAQAHNNLAVAYESKGNFEAALAGYKTATELDPGNKIYMSNYNKFKQNYERTHKRNGTQDARQADR